MKIRSLMYLLTLKKYSKHPEKSSSKNKMGIMLLFILTLFSFKEAPATEENIKGSAYHKNFIISPEDYTVDDCYDYLTELVRSSNFPFSSWKIDRNKVNLLIDEEDSETITCKLFYDTEGTGTIGWIQYHKKNGKLFNTSAELDHAVELKYNVKWRGLFNSCASGKQVRRFSL